MATRITCKIASKLIGMSEEALSDVLKSGQIDFGTVITPPGRKRAIYMISPAKLAEYLGITTAELDEKVEDIIRRNG